MHYRKWIVFIALTSQREQCRMFPVFFHTYISSFYPRESYFAIEKSHHDICRYVRPCITLPYSIGDKRKDIPNWDLLRNRSTSWLLDVKTWFLFFPTLFPFEKLWLFKIGKVSKDYSYLPGICIWNQNFWIEKYTFINWKCSKQSLQYFINLFY